jgi:hypothetical protein
VLKLKDSLVKMKNKGMLQIWDIHQLYLFNISWL